MYSKFFKRIIDFILSFFILVLVSPILLISMILIKLNSKGPIFFVQYRLGLSSEEFKILKFRTMTHKERVANGEVLPGNPEVTAVGAILRRLKIDELPQLINVLSGDMSIVGPRPALPEQLDEYTDTAKRRMDVRPGITGLAQVNGNIYISWQERWKLDIEYVDNLSIFLDVKILFKTIVVVLFGEKKFKK